MLDCRGYCRSSFASSAPHPSVVILPSVNCDVLFCERMQANRNDRLFQTCSVFGKLRKKIVSPLPEGALARGCSSLPCCLALYDKMYFQHELEVAMKREMNKNELSLADIRRMYEKVSEFAGLLNSLTFSYMRRMSARDTLSLFISRFIAISSSC